MTDAILSMISAEKRLQTRHVQLQDRSGFNTFFNLKKTQCVKTVKGIWVSSLEIPILLYANNKCAEQPVHPRCLSSTFEMYYYTRGL